MFTLMTMILISSLLFMMLNHPLSMGAILLMSTISVSLTVGFFNYNFWYSYLLFIIMIGGMLVLFAYMTSVASNEKFKFSIKITLMMLMMSPFIVIASMMDPYITNMNNLNMDMYNIKTFKLSLNKFINYPSSSIMFMLIIYLLITLIAVVKITNINKGPLRQMN